MLLNYFCTYRYNAHGDVVDGNIVVSVERKVVNESDIRAIENMIGQEVGVPPEGLGLTNIVLLGSPDG